MLGKKQQKSCCSSPDGLDRVMDIVYGKDCRYLEAVPRGRHELVKQWLTAKEDLDFYPSLFHARGANNARASLSMILWIWIT